MSSAPLEQIPQGAVITLDSAPNIYFLQDHPTFAPFFAPVMPMKSTGALTRTLAKRALWER